MSQRNLSKGKNIFMTHILNGKQNRFLQQLGLTTLALAWISDQLFYQKNVGISFPIVAALTLAAGILLTWLRGEKAPPSSLPLTGLALLFAVLTILRQEPFSRFLSFSLALLSLLLLASTWLGGRWWLYGAVDYLLNTLRVLYYSLVVPAESFIRSRKSDPRHAEEPQTAHTAFSGQPAGSNPKHRSLPRSTALGLFLALPVVSLLGLLLAAADPIFAQELNRLLELLKLEKLFEYLLRLVGIAILAYVLAGVYLYSLFFSRAEKVLNEKNNPLPRLLGWIEASIVLACTNAMFAFFVMVQFRYFFGGQENIHLEGFTYAEYARRGFGELVFVAFISLLLFLTLSTFVRKEGLSQGWFFSALGLVLVVLVGIILASAFQRLLLYEDAYGFSRIRSYTHIFMLWLGLLLGATALLEITGKLRRFALTCLLITFGFSLTLVSVNVDGLIVHQNLNRAARGHDLDSAYLVSLSEDAVPALFEYFEGLSQAPHLRNEVGGILSCRIALRQDREKQQTWASFHLAEFRAGRLYDHYQQELDAYPVHRESSERSEYWVSVNGEQKPCQNFFRLD
jgi:hypothetical protein